MSGLFPGPSDYFPYVKGEIHCERVPLTEIAQAVGTPVYVYSLAAIRKSVNTFQRAFRDLPVQILYAVKANSTLAILQALSRSGCGADVVSLGELKRALKAGVLPDQITFSGVGKSQFELEYAVNEGIQGIHVESLGEWQRLKEIASLRSSSRSPVTVRLRILPKVSSGGHDYVMTGRDGDKFGLTLEEAHAIFAQGVPDGIKIVGLSVHVGSQVPNLKGHIQAWKILRLTAEKLEKRFGIILNSLDLGGGFYSVYKKEKALSASAIRKAILSVWGSWLEGGKSRELSVEPGRLLVANAGLLLTEIQTVKTRNSKSVVVVDAGMNDLVRPSLYGSYHEIVSVMKPKTAKRKLANVVGPVCESGDFFARNRTLRGDIDTGSLLAVLSAGAYGSSMASRYNSRPLVPEVLVDGRQWLVVRERESFDDLIRREQLFPIE